MEFVLPKIFFSILQHRTGPACTRADSSEGDSSQLSEVLIGCLFCVTLDSVASGYL